MSAPAVRLTFWDVGGVVLSNGWDHDQRAAAAHHFGLDAEEFNRRHAAQAEAFESGQLGMQAYLEATVFYQPRPFPPEAVWRFMREQSQPLPGTLALLDELKRAGRAAATLNNESRELNEYRIARFGLRRWFDFFCSSCYLGARKPRPEIYRRALGVAQCAAAEALFVDDREENVAAARAVGMRAVRFESVAQLRRELAELGVAGLAPAQLPTANRPAAPPVGDDRGRASLPYHSDYATAIDCQADAHRRAGHAPETDR